MSNQKQFNEEKAYLCQKQGASPRYFTLRQLEAMGSDPGGETHDGWRITDAPEVPDEAKEYVDGYPDAAVFESMGDTGSTGPIGHQGPLGPAGNRGDSKLTSEELTAKLLDREKQIEDLKAENEFLPIVRQENAAKQEAIDNLLLANEQLAAELKEAQEALPKKATKTKKNSDATIGETEGGELGNDSDTKRAGGESAVEGGTGNTEAH